MSSKKYAPSSELFDWIFTICSGIWIIGAYVDGWAHTHLDSALETIFTPWHAIFYSGIFLSGLCLATMWVLNVRKGYSASRALPKEYMFALWGIIIALCAGVGDFCWHTFFGIEKDIEALLSPTHLLLAAGGAISVSGPLHAVWFRKKKELIHNGPTILSATYFMSVITFMFQFLHPYMFPWVAKSFADVNGLALDFSIMLGVGSVLVFTVIFLGMVFSTMRHWHFPFGSFTWILTINAVLSTAMMNEHYEFIVAAFLGGCLVDFIYNELIVKNSHKMSHVHTFGFLAPVLIFSMYMATVFLNDTIAWSVHVWAGTIVIAGITGYLLSYLVIPTEISE
jgi:hypothetical protein